MRCLEKDWECQLHHAVQLGLSKVSSPRLPSCKAPLGFEMETEA
jgi:hypothetical protein